MYLQWQNIPPPKTWQQFDMREFDDVEIAYSSMAYLADISSITRYSKLGSSPILNAVKTHQRNSHEVFHGDWGLQYGLRSHG